MITHYLSCNCGMIVKGHSEEHVKAVLLTHQESKTHSKQTELRKEVLIKEEVKNIPAKLTVSGFAPTREILFSFKESLEEDSLFVNVTFPPSNWVNATDIIFSVSLELAP